MQNASLIRLTTDRNASLNHDPHGYGVLRPDKRLLFFSGGSALNPLASHLKNLSKNSIHLISPFDSGGSSGKLRRAFSIPAFGDLRSRISVLLDQNSAHYDAVKSLLNYRFDMNISPEAGVCELKSLSCGSHQAMFGLGGEFKAYAQAALGNFLASLPKNFDLSGANVGNLIFTGAYIERNNNLDAVLQDLNELLPINGSVRFTANVDLQLKALLASGEEVVGQHLITGKEVEPLNEKICKLRLASSGGFECNNCQIDALSRFMIEQADLICFPPGSFYSSLIANLLPLGITDAIAKNNGPKVYVPNLGVDPEQYGMNGQNCLEVLVDSLKNGESAEQSCLLTHILMDSNPERYRGGFDSAYISKHNIEIVSLPLVSADSAPYYSPQKLAEALMGLAR